jgi:hemerythrin-like metal-binding protein
MLQIEWDIEYCTGIELVDTQNKHFVGLLNVLFEIQQNEPEAGLLYRMLRETMDRLHEHFVQEEQFYGRHAPLEADSHRRQHYYFLKTVDHFEDDALNAESTAAQALCEYLREWTIFHILNFDKHIACAIQQAMHI